MWKLSKLRWSVPIGARRRLTMSMVFVLLLAVWATGCADRSSSTDNEEEAVQEVTPAPEKRAPSDARLEEVDWEAADEHLGISNQRLDSSAKAKAEESPVPVLLPDDDELLASAHITVGDAWYTASMSGANHSVVFAGTHRVHDMPGSGKKEEKDDRRPEAHTLTRTHGIVSLSFESFGVAYAIDVECEEPTKDPLCLEDDYVVSLAEEAGVIRDGK